MTDTRPLVALGIPAGDRVHTEFMQCVWAVGRGARDHRQGIVVGQSSMIVNARAQVVDGAQHIKADYLMFVDSDMTFPWDVIDRLLKHDKDIVGCTYVRRGPPFDNLGQAVDPAWHGKEMTGLMEMTHLPTGMMLIKMPVFDRLVKPYFRFQANEALGITDGEDVIFCRAVRALGFKVWCDLDLSKEIGHMYQYMMKPTDPAVRAQTEHYTKAGVLKPIKGFNGAAAHG